MGRMSLKRTALRRARVGAYGLLFLAATIPFCSAPAQTETSSSPLGPNVRVVRPDSDMASTQAAIDRIFAEQQHAEFGPARYAIVFAPGQYRLHIPIGFYTQVLGLGRMPDDVRILGDVHVDEFRGGSGK
jgi:hypothetical protein